MKGLIFEILVVGLTMLGIAKVAFVLSRRAQQSWIERVFSERDAHIRQRIAEGAFSKEIKWTRGHSCPWPLDPH